MDKKDRELMVKIGKRLGTIEKELKQMKKPKQEVMDTVVMKIPEIKSEINSMELEFFLQLPEKEVADISVALRTSILEIMRKVGIKQMKCNISQE
jgi:hypothetical protein